MNEDNKLGGLLSDPLLRDYLSLNDRLIRLAASRIAAESELIKSKAADSLPLEGETDRILAMCSRLMQVAELYTMLAGAVSEEPYIEAIELSDFIGRFTDKCGRLLDGVCRFATEQKENVFIDASRDVLTYILLSYVRNAVLKGADSVRIGCGSSDGKCYINIDVTLGKTSSFERFGDFQTVHGDEILQTLSARIGAEYEATESGMMLTFRTSNVNPDSELRAPRQEYEAGLFSEYNIMLGDLAKGITDL